MSDIPEPEIPPNRICDVCEVELPETANYFERTNSTDDPWRKTCKLCRSNQRKVAGTLAISEAVEKTENSLGIALEQLQQMPKTDGVVHSARLYECLLSAFGGPEGLAQQYISTYMMAKPGGQTRSNMLAKVVNMGEFLTKEGVAKKPLDLMDEHELDEVVKEIMGRAQEAPLAGPPKLIDGELCETT